MPAFPKPTATETDPVAGPNLTTHTALTTTAHGGIVASDDARLTNARTPTAHKTTHATGQSDAIAPSDIGAATAAAAAAAQSTADGAVVLADTKVPKSDIDTDSTFAANSDTKVPSQKAVKTADLAVAALAQAPGRDLTNFRVGQLRKFHAALSRAVAGLGVCRVNVYGDSIGQGWSSTAPMYKNAWVPRLRAALVSVYGSGGGGVCLPWKGTLDGTYENDPRWVFTGTWTGRFGSGAMNRACIYTTDTAAKASFTYEAPCDRYIVYLFAAVSSGNVSIDIDGGTPTIVNTFLSGSNTGYIATTVTAPSRGMHTVNVSLANAGLRAEIVGIEPCDSAAGLRVSRLAVQAAASGDLNNSGSAFIFDAVPPDLSIIGMGVNDFQTQTSLGNTSPVMKANLQTAITKAKTTGDVILLVEPPPGVAGTIPWTDYVTAMYELAVTNDVPIFDLTARWGSYAISNASPLSMYQDTVHPAPAAQGDLVDALAGALGVPTVAFTPGSIPAVPGQVTGLTAGAATGTTQPLTWTPPSGSPTTYKVEYKANASGTWLLRGFIAGPAITITGLTQNTSYDYRITAYNDGGAGTVSSTLTASTGARTLAELGAAAVFWGKPETLAALSDTNPVATWPDSSSHGNDLTQGTSGKRPLYRTGQQNGLAAVVADGTDDFLSKSAVSFPNNGVSFFAVSRQDAAGSGPVIAAYSPQFTELRYNSTTRVPAMVDNSAFALATAVTLASWHQISGVYDGAADTIAVWVDGALGASNSDTQTLPTSGIVSLFARSAPGNYLQGAIGEVLIFDFALTTTERQVVEAYLKAKWATP